ASTTKWDARAAVVTAPPNRMFVLNAPTRNPRSQATFVVGGGMTPRTGLRVGLAYASGDYASASEVTGTASNGRHLDMISLEGEFAFAYTRLTGESTHDTLETAAGQAVAT